MRIDLLKSEGCSHAAETEPLLRDVAAALAPDATLAVTAVESPEQALALGFAGSPTVLVDGVDLEPDAVPIAGFG